MKTHVRSFAYYCTCGVAMTGSIGPASRVSDLEQAFLTIHSGEGHAQTDAATARRERARRERLEARRAS